MRTRMITIGLATAVATAMATGALAAPPHGEGGTAHTHHVHTGDGDCVDLDSNAFFREPRGLHWGAQNSGPDHGPWHTSCAVHEH